MKFRILAILIFVYALAFSQEDQEVQIGDKPTVHDEKYLEDQFYISASYQRLLKLPEQITQTGFSYSISLGYIRDIPLNKRRNIGLGAGIGYQFNVHYFNIRNETDNPDNNDVLKSNKLVFYMAELPIQFRFRTSTADKYRFWRFYPGILISYAFAHNHSLKQSEDLDVNDILAIDNLQYGISFSAGYNNWNLYLYYGISDLFTNVDELKYVFAPNEIKMGITMFFL